MLENAYFLSNILVSGGGRIKCIRCTAKSKRTGLQCGRPALKVSRTKKCQFHGGRSSGPKTDVGRASISRAHLIHGDETRSKRLERAEKKLWFAHIEDIMHVLAMTSMSRQRGRKPLGYKKITTLDQANAFIELDKTLG
jgi:hypothetical protein